MGRTAVLGACAGSLGVGLGLGYLLARWRRKRSAGAGAGAGLGLGRLEELGRWLEEAVLDEVWGDDREVQRVFEEAFEMLVRAFGEYIKGMGIAAGHVERVVKMCRYTIKGGKCNRGLVVLTNTRDICKFQSVPFTKQMAAKAIVLGWCIEILQACFLVLDDVMDKSITRRGQPCWYQLPEVQLDAINDGLIIESFIYFLLRECFISEPYYLNLVHLYQEVALKTQLGQMLDLLSQPQGRKGPEVLSGFSKELYERIVVFKTAFYTFYIPIASSMIICGLDDPKHLQVAEAISIQLGIKFQIQDDFLDCFGKPEHIGKIGTDVQDHKCTWLLVSALEKASLSQRNIIDKNLGKDMHDNIERIKQLYEEMGLRDLYAKQEEKSYEDIVAMIEKHQNEIPPIIFNGALARIHNRTK